MRQRLVVFIFFLHLVVWAPVSSYAQSQFPIKHVGMPFIYNYNEGDYNIGRTVYSILQGNDGIMYFGNDDGVLFYDGHLWRLITLPNNSKV